MLQRNDSNESDRIIAQGMIDGDTKAYIEFTERFSGLIYQKCMSFRNDSYEADDLLNEILIRIVAAIGRYDPERAALSTWVMHVTKNFLIDFYRKKIDEPVVVACENEYIDYYCYRNRTREYSEKERSSPDVERLSTAMKGISGKEKDILQCRAEGFTYKCIGEWFGIMETTARKIHNRAVKRIRARFGDTDGV